MIRKILVANRSEIAIRVMRAATELGIQTVAIYAEEDKLSLHRFKADESYVLDREKGPIQAYLDIDRIIEIALQCGAEAIHPGYGFLSENPEFAERCRHEGILFIGPSPEKMRKFGDKVSARKIAIEAKVPVIPASNALSSDTNDTIEMARSIGYPIMVKSSWGGGGRGMRVVESEQELLPAVASAQSEALTTFGKDEVYLEKLIKNACHVEVQLLGDQHGRVVHLFERDCSIQRRNQKVIERAPAPYLSETQRAKICAYALRVGEYVAYDNVGTVEFLMDRQTGEFYFIEVNPRIQVEHTVTEQVTGIDIVKAQILIAQGGEIGRPSSGVPDQADIQMSGHAIQCRITTENPEDNFSPDCGRITAYRGAMGFGVRLDGGTAYSGATVTPYYDSLLEKVTATAVSSQGAIDRMSRALQEFRIRGVTTNLGFLNNIINHQDFKRGDYSTGFIDKNLEQLKSSSRRDRASKILRYIADVTVNGNPEVRDQAVPVRAGVKIPLVSSFPAPDVGTRHRLLELGPDAFCRELRHQERVYFTDTTMRDAHQSLLATRMRTHDLIAIAPFYAHRLHNLFSIECWGGATFDTAMRFLKECPWSRLIALREAMPNIPLQMLIRGANAVGYTNYPDNVVVDFVSQAARNGVDVFRVFDALNWAENMFVCMDAVLESGAVCEATICYSGDLTDPHESKYTLDYYLKLALAFEARGAHILAIKDMAGVCKPAAIAQLVKALRAETSLPVHFHTHDTSGGATASVLAAIHAGADIVDAAADSMSGTTSQPPIGVINHMLDGLERQADLDRSALQTVSDYWRGVRTAYGAFESETKSGDAAVYTHAMPGGQYSNLKRQAQAIGIDDTRWQSVVDAYANVNDLFGDIVKVTPSSKVVGDMALAMVSSGWTTENVLDPDYEISFPKSVVSFFRGEMGRPIDGFPSQLQAKVLKNEAPLTVRPGSLFEPLNFDSEHKKLSAEIGRAPSQAELISYILYPDVFIQFEKDRAKFGDVSILPSPTYFYGMLPGEEISVTLERGKSLNILCYSVSKPSDHGRTQVFFSLNGQPRTIEVEDRSIALRPRQIETVSPLDKSTIGAPMPGRISQLFVQKGDKVVPGQAIAVLEAMKMETRLDAEIDGHVDTVAVNIGQDVELRQLIARIVER